ncbi:MAG: type II toxin-antitoxin system VapC family toxin [Acidimicrobiia bacterium]|nr:type II toxin-antitoxin system VapC family toxin [Acidimicrobiia bacterium]MYG72442.1 type II toxin-antitoxin system VapC family toxin [Acidimicrobiia bacterium]MYL08438.1 type II toxin-antitoxin system VapC family toxin [Acidimicrobiia bacterium]
MIVLDAYPVVGLLRDEPVADEVQALLESGTPAWLTPLGVAEVVDRRVRLDAVDPEAVFVNLVQFGLANPMPLDSRTAARAGALRARHYHRTTRSVSLADCVVAETARAAQARVATSDPHLLDLCADEGIQTIPLPDSRGHRWTPRAT